MSYNNPSINKTKVITMYQNFLLLNSQIFDSNQAKFLIDEHEIIVSASSNNFWKIKSPLPVNCQRDLHLVLSGRERYYFENKESYLFRDSISGEVFLVLEVPEVTKYIVFRTLMKKFLELKALWDQMEPTLQD